jgi:hypothetical protein
VNIDFPLANRALARIGADPLTWSDRQGDTLRWRALKDSYLESFLEALSEVDWTGGRKRKPLWRSGLPHGDAGMAFVYDLPADCSRPLELLGGAYFVIEGRLLATDEARAELLYVANGRALRPLASVSPGRPGSVPEEDYLTAGRPWNVAEATLRAGRPADVPAAIPPDPEPDEDYPGYRPPRYEPKFYEHLELALAAKLCLLLAKNINLHSQLLREAAVAKEEAVIASRGASAAKLRPQKWWKEELGL